MIHENYGCATCGGPHEKGSTYNHRYVRRVVDNSLELIAPGQRLPYMRGAAVAFGLMGMASAIQKHVAHMAMLERHRLASMPLSQEEVAYLQGTAVRVVRGPRHNPGRFGR